ncbi:hypothetical protein [Yersinia intermedia]|uniref:hypothetical protein n=1 Tax=Yersinia intermedia TaxID=631 RepID=UPI00065D0AF3|nr:hypothetical protein [Yersinia intermedia]CRY83528.1 Uncharacterised protein [Yersinia intermedia]
MLPLKIIKFSIFLLVSATITGCANGKVDPESTPKALHLKKSEDYKKRPGWAVIENLTRDDCKVFKSHGQSLINWGDSTCTPNKLIETINTKPEMIPILYAAYHEYGVGKAGEVSGMIFDGAGLDESSTQSLRFMSNLTKRISNKEIANGIYSDFKSDRWSMGLIDISEQDFKSGLDKFASRGTEIENEYKQAENDRIAKKAQNNERISQERAKHKAGVEAVQPSVRVYPDFGPNPSESEKVIKKQLDQIHFTKGQYVDEEGNLHEGSSYYVEGRQIFPTGNFDVVDFIRSIRLTIQRCYEVGAYTDSKTVNNACIGGIADGIKEWGAAARDKSISDRAWFAGAYDGRIRHTPITDEILFSHWAGMARVYSARGM